MLTYSLSREKVNSYKMKAGVLVFVVLAALVSVWGSPLVPSVGMLNVQFSAIVKVFIEKDPFLYVTLTYRIRVPVLLIIPAQKFQRYAKFFHFSSSILPDFS